MTKIIDRYILREISSPFFISLFSITLVLILGRILQLMDLMVNKGVGILDILQLIFFLLPSFLLFTIPISLLLSFLIGLGRLSSDNEITVLKMAGISLYRLSSPLVFASTAALIITLVLSLFVVPSSNHAISNLLFSILKQNATVGIKEKIFNDNFKGLLIYTNRIPPHGNFMEGVIISDSRITKEPSTIFAEKAYLVSDPESLQVILRLESGSIHTMDLKRRNYRKVDFSFYDINLDMGAKGAASETGRAKESAEMTVVELVEKIRSPELPEEVKREYLVELNNKFIFPFACLIFGLLGLPLGVRIRTSARARGLTMGIIIILLYYIFQLGGTAVTETGKVAPWIGLWFPNLIFTVFGLILFVRTVKEKSISWGHFTKSLKRIPGKRKRAPK